MGQRINIQYSVDIDELDQEVLRMLSNSFSAIESLGSFCVTPAAMLSLATVENIDALRQELAKIDFALYDAATIINAYVGYKAELSTQEELVSYEPQEDSASEAPDEIPS